MPTRMRFWSALETFPGLAAPAAEWRSHLGTEWSSSQGLLRPTGEQAELLLVGGQPHRVIEHEPGRVAVVPEEGGPTTRLPSEDASILRADHRVIERVVASAFALEPCSGTSMSANGGFVGRKRLSAATACEVHLCISLGGLDFEPAIHYETERLPVAMAIASFDSTPFLDIVVANNMDDSISVFQNDPLKPGVMQHVSNIPVGKSPVSLAALDVDQDGRMDIALARFYSGPVTGALHIIRNETVDGKAISFSVSEQIPLEVQFPHTLIASDVNGNGIDDLIVLGFSFTSQVKGQVLLNLPITPVPGDLNGDGADVGTMCGCR